MYFSPSESLHEESSEWRLAISRSSFHSPLEHNSVSDGAVLTWNIARTTILG
jgi:hypothetical protein